MFWFEKMCSGAYLGAIASIAIRAAATENLLSASVAETFSTMQDVSLIDIDRFLAAPYSDQTAIGALLA